MNPALVHEHGPDVVFIELHCPGGIISGGDARFRQENDGAILLPRLAIIQREIVPEPPVVVSDAPGDQNAAIRKRGEVSSLGVIASVPRTQANDAYSDPFAGAAACA